MRVDTKKYLRENPCYLVALLVFASEGDHELIRKVYSSEKEAYDGLRIAKAYAGSIQVHSPADFPISLTPQNQMRKIPERLAGLIFAGQDWFWSMPCSLPAERIYDDIWLTSTFNTVEQKIIKTKYEELVQDLAHPIDSTSR